ncbi:hypothetical protein GJU43_05655 [Flavobacterium sp. LC2016-23]|uniref:hypothetical protein n=1 Tax=Flavobacterium sp. LC2016-23 TaxID=2666330 RepID=UPI0012AEE077|nr:hypothetical protein [Flavobacterium sp. LC2016-23]MRX38750.1 hypothetical protein [Flavobacterium sp. LC2016-23]
MIVAINYSNETFKKAAKLNAFTAKHFGKVDKVISYSPNDVDEYFKIKNSKIFENKRGDGCWLWKPYFISKTLSELNEFDYLVYVDSGICYLNKIDYLIDKMNGVKQDIFYTQTPLLEVQYTHPEVIKALNAEPYKFTNQAQAGLMVIRKTDFSVKFIQDWLDLCQDSNLLTGNFDDCSSEPFYISHREDQSLFSVLTKKHDLKPFMDCTDYGRFPVNYLHNDILFKITHYESNYKLDKTVFLLFRKANPFIYFLKFILKKIFASIGFTRHKFLTDLANLKI